MARILGWALAASMAMAATAQAQEQIKVAAGQRGNWDTSISELGQRGGIFKKHGLTLDIIYTQGSGETLQAVIAKSVDVGVSVGTMGVFAAYGKGAPVRIIGAEMTGGADLYWYVKTESPIKALKDVGEGRTIAYSTNGASTHSIVLAFISQYGLKAKPVATGNPPSTLTQVMSGQIDVGWAAPPFGLDQIDQKQIRVLGNGNDAAVFKGQTVRMLVTNTATLAARKPAIEKYLAAYRETVDWIYADPAALKIYADWLGISLEKAQRSRDGFFPKDGANPDRIVGLDQIVKDAVAMKYTATPLTKEQLAELIQIPPRNK
jgi:NitT/TauT family transport system substrate-binding protein